MALIHYRPGFHIAKQDIHIQFTLSEGTYSIDDFNGKSNVAVLQRRQDWKCLKLKLFIPENYIFMSSNVLFAALGIPFNYLG